MTTKKLTFKCKMKTCIIFLCFTLVHTQIFAQCWQVISAGYAHTLAVKTDGTLWSWGNNSEGQLGNGTHDDKFTPTQVGNGTNWQAVSAGYDHSLGIKADGTLWAWGNNVYGRLGDGTAISKLSPTQIGNANNWQTIWAGAESSFAIKADGTLWAWGNNTFGQLGDGTIADRYIPTQIGNNTSWLTVNNRLGHTVALKTDGSLWAWGLNTYGQLGDGTNIDKIVPTQIGAGNTWQAISAGYGGFTIGIRTDGTLWCWGSNGYGQLGDGTNIDIPVQTQIGLANNWKEIGTGGTYSMGRKLDGTLWGWGNNGVGQLGDGTTFNRNVPTQVVGMNSNWQKLSVGYFHTFSLKTDISLWAWGMNAYYQLGDATNVDKNIPANIICGPSQIEITNSSMSLISVYPNPVSNELFIKSDKQNLFYQIINSLGQVMLTDLSQLNEPVNISKLQKGMYFIKIDNTFLKFIKN